MKLYLATGNLHKIEELKAMLSAAKVRAEVLSPQDVGGMPEVDEDQDSFTGNALKKAHALAAKIPSETWALADDSGLCVDALDGAPGVFSARYAGESASDDENIDKLLTALAAKPAETRAAGFRCHLALVSQSGDEHVFEGECRGKIQAQRTGEGGFGYDPVFIPEGYSKSFAELSSAEKAKLSHRGKAMELFLAWLKTN